MASCVFLVIGFPLRLGFSAGGEDFLFALGFLGLGSAGGGFSP